jgi:hypothetical protein
LQISRVPQIRPPRSASGHQTAAHRQGDCQQRGDSGSCCA